MLPACMLTQSRLAKAKRAPAFSMGSPRHVPAADFASAQRGPGRYDAVGLEVTRPATPKFSMGHRGAHQPLPRQVGRRQLHLRQVLLDHRAQPRAPRRAA